MKQVIFLSTVLSFFLFFTNNQEVLATRQKRAAPPPPPPKGGPPPPPKGGPPPPPKGGAPSPKDSKLPPEKYCDWGICHQTLHSPKQFDAKADAIALKKAMEVPGANKKDVVNILTTRGILQRLQIAEAYKPGDLVADLKKKLSGKYEDSIVALMTPLPVYLAQEIHDPIMKGNDMEAIVEILCTVSNAGKKEIISSYQSLYRKSLKDDLTAKTTGVTQKLLVSFLETNRDETYVTKGADAIADATTLFKAGPKRWGEPQCVKIFNSRSILLLVRIITEYKKVASQTIQEHIKKDLPGKDGEGLLIIVRCFESKSNFYAERLHAGIKRANLVRGMKDRTVIRIIVSRSEIDLKDTADSFLALYQKSIDDMLTEKTGGNYEATLVGLVKGRDSDDKGPKWTASRK